MRTRNLLFIFITLLTAHGGSAQKFYNQQSNFLNANKVWAFHARAGLDFNTGRPISIRTSLDGMDERGRGSNSEGAASVCDPISGALLFYTNGFRIWDKNGQVMPNGAGLLGNSYRSSSFFPPAVSTTQGACIVPFIDEPGKYYVFSLAYQNYLVPHAPTNLQQSFAAYYSIVDMNLNNGLGDIVPNSKNIPLTPNGMRFSEAMIAVPGNCNDIWLLLHRSDSAVYDAYSITKEGISLVPVTSRTGGPKSSPYFYYLGGMAISPDRTKLAFCSEFIFDGVPWGGYGAIAEFDPGSGTISNEIILGGISNSTDTLFRCVSRMPAFSPNSSKLYTQEFDIKAVPSLVQYDVSVYRYDSINKSRQVISKNVAIGGGYLRLYGDTIYSADTFYVNAIADPDKKGIACNYIYKAIKLLSDTGKIGKSGMSLTNEVVYPIKDSMFNTNLDTMICRLSEMSDGITLFPSERNTTYKYTWNDFSSSSSLNAMDTGIYWVAYHNSCSKYIVDTFRIQGAMLRSPEITIKVYQLGTTEKYYSYQWLLNGNVLAEARDSIYTVTENGAYQVIVTNEAGCADTSAIYTVTNVDETGIAEIPNLAGQIRVYPNPATDVFHIATPVAIDVCILSLDGRIVKRAKDVKSIRVSGLSTGFYYLKVVDRSGRLLKVEKIIKISK